MTSADAAATVRRIITDAYQTDPAYRALIEALTDLGSVAVPAEGRERTWNTIKQGQAVEPEAQSTRAIAASTEPALLFRETVQTPCQDGVPHSGAVLVLEGGR